MPEGDTIFRLARRLDGWLAGQEVLRSSGLAVDLAGRRVEGVTSCGKHLLLRLSGGLTLHSHLRMDGAWALTGPGKRLPPDLAARARVAIETPAGTAHGVDLPVCELLATADEPRVVGHLGPDLLGPGWDEAEALRRLAAEPDRPVVEALLDQRNLAGIGNLWAVETCFLRGLWPWRPVSSVEDLAGAVRLARRMLRHSAETDGRQVTTGSTRRGEAHWAYGRADRPCRRCGTPIALRRAAAGTRERETWWCPTCQPEAGPAPGAAPPRPAGRQVGGGRRRRP